MFLYYLVRSNRKSIAISIDENGEILVKAPGIISQREIEEFLEQKTKWIQTTKAKQAERQKHRRVFTEEEIVSYREQAKKIFSERVHGYEIVIGVKANRICVRDQKTRWGSCSSRGNINLNWRLVLAPREVMDYVIVHELCHLKEMNHSKDFWDLVERVFPDYRMQKQWLKENAEKLGM